MSEQFRLTPLVALCAAFACVSAEAYPTRPIRLVAPFVADVSTMKEQGIENLELTGSWHGWFAPAKTPPAILARLHQEVVKALQVPRVREAIVTGGYEPDGSSPAAFRKFLRAESDRYAEMVRIANVPRQ